MHHVTGISSCARRFEICKLDRQGMGAHPKLYQHPQPGKRHGDVNIPVTLIMSLGRIRRAAVRVIPMEPLAAWLTRNMVAAPGKSLQMG